MERFLSQMEVKLIGQPLTVPVIMNLVSILNQSAASHCQQRATTRASSVSAGLAAAHMNLPIVQVTLLTLFSTTNEGSSTMINLGCQALGQRFSVVVVLALQLRAWQGRLGNAVVVKIKIQL